MDVTIIADASFCPDTGAAGYSFWIACERGKDGKHGAIKAQVKDSTEAEMMALLNGLHYAHKEIFVMPGDVVLLQSDCKNALEILENFETHKRPEIDKLLKFFAHLIKTSEIKVRFKHVKGHTSAATNKGARYAVNRICDKQAKKQMKRKRRELKETGNE